MAPQSMAAPVALLAPTPSSPIHADGAGYSPTTDSCSKCHRTHSASDARLLRGATSEETCYTCHNGTGAPSVLAQFGRASIHPINTSPEIHRPGESSPPDFSGSKRHVECVDCHDAHQSASGNHTKGSSFAAGTSQGLWGIDAANGAAWTTPIFSMVPQVATEAQLCFKCHSAWAYGGSPPTSHAGGIVETDQALEFNVNNVSYHWVEGDKTAANGATPRTNDGRRLTFAAGSGWTATSAMTCTDCHASNASTEPRGAHGSTNAYLLAGTWSTTQYGLCLQCHDATSYSSSSAENTPNSTGFSDGQKNLHALHVGGKRRTCAECHSAVPHGGQYRAMLAPRSVNGTAVPITDYNRNSRLTINRFSASGAWRASDCSGCH